MLMGRAYMASPAAGLVDEPWPGGWPLTYWIRQQRAVALSW
jgi:hypothetical protein